MADIAITAASVAVSNRAEIRRDYNFGATMGAGRLVYLDSGNRWQLLGATAVGTGVDDLRGLTLNGGSNGQPASVVTRDPGLVVGGTIANGVAYYGSTNVGNIAPVADVTAGNYPVLLGIARSTTVLNFNPIAAGIAI